MECISALHHNKRKTNYHIHLIFSESELLPEPIEKIATRNMFYNEHGKHVRTKKEILDDSGNIRKGCKIVKKGEAYERTLFTAKNKLIKQENFLDEAKLFYTDLINLLIEDDKEKLHVFNKNGLYLATKKIGKNNPKAEQIREDNEVRMRWNYEVDRAIVSEVPEEKIRQIKQEWITDRVRESVEIFGSRPERLAGIITTAIMKLALLISKVLETARKLKARLILENLIDTQERRVAEPHKPQIPPKPAMPPDAAVYPKLQRIKNELDKQNEIIFKAEYERNLLEIERDDLHGISRLTKRRGLDSKIERKNEEIDILKSGLSGIVKRYGFDTVQQFYNAIKIAQDATYKYQMDVATWEENYGEKTPPKATFEERLRIYQREADQQHTQRNYHSRDKGAR